VLTAALVLAFRRADRPRPVTAAGGTSDGSAGKARRHARAKRARSGTAAIGMVLCTVGVLGFSAVGFGGLLAGRTATLLVLPVSPLLATALLATGAALLRPT
jgi:hypothetical protein